MARIPKKKAQAKAVNPNQDWEAIGLEVKTMLTLLRQFESAADANDRWLNFEKNTNRRRAHAEFEANKRMRLQATTDLLAAQIAHEGIGRIATGDITTAIKLADQMRSALAATSDPLFLPLSTRPPYGEPITEPITGATNASLAEDEADRHRAPNSEATSLPPLPFDDDGGGR